MLLKNLKYIHFSGIKGVGMTALALYCQDMGIKITGSDVAEDFVTSEVLKKRNIAIALDFKKENIPSSAQALIYTAAKLDNPEINFAKKNELKVLSYAQALAELAQDKKTIAVCGVGGKSTVSSMIAYILHQAGMDPSFVVGVGNIKNLKIPGRHTHGKYVVVEADDYASFPGIDNTPKFLYLKPSIIVLTNIEFDHPDIYADLNATKEAFTEFVNKLPSDGLLVANIDNKNIQQMIGKMQNIHNCEIQTYGFSPQAEWKIEKVSCLDKKTLASISIKGITIDLELRLPGKFNVLNACASLITATHLGVSQNKTTQALCKFSGIKRRFEKLGTYKQVEIWDDYAHHPTEIEATLLAAKQWFPEKNITAVFQPHTYSRTTALLDEFSTSFVNADKVIITDIYSSARENEDLSISGFKLAQAIAKNHKQVKYVSFQDLLEYLRLNISQDEVIITLGAGNIYKIAQKLSVKQ